MICIWNWNVIDIRQTVKETDVQTPLLDIEAIGPPFVIANEEISSCDRPTDGGPGIIQPSLKALIQWTDTHTPTHTHKHSGILYGFE